MGVPEPTEQDERRWAKWDDLRARKAQAQEAEDLELLEELAAEEEALREESGREVLEQDMARPESWWWLSFCDPNKDKGEQFLGVIIIQGGGIGEATQNAWAMGINPGGEVACWPVDDEHLPDEKYRRRLLSKDDLSEAGLA